MKKFFSILLLINFLGLILIPAMVSAQMKITPPEKCTMKYTITLGEKVCTKGIAYDVGGEDAICCIFNTIYNVTDWIFMTLVAVAAIMVIIGAFTLLTAAGNPEQVSKGRNYILYAAIGLIVGLLAKAVPAIVKLIGGF